MKASSMDVLEVHEAKLQKPGRSEMLERKKFVTPGGPNGAPGRHRADEDGCEHNMRGCELELDPRELKSAK